MHDSIFLANGQVLRSSLKRLYILHGSAQPLSCWIASSLVARRPASIGLHGKHFEQIRLVIPGGGHTFVAQNCTELMAPPARQPHALLRLSRWRKRDVFETLWIFPFSRRLKIMRTGV